jgi:PhnB protein
MAVKPIPEGHSVVSPYLVVKGVAQLLEFVKNAFEATETYRLARPDGGVGHAEVRIGDSTIMMGEPTGDFTAKPCMLHVYVADVDTVYKRALQAGATSVTPPADQFYGDRRADVKDAFGNQWFIATHKEDLSAAEISRRAAAMHKA